MRRPGWRGHGWFCCCSFAVIFFDQVIFILISPGSIYSSFFYLNPADGEVFGPFEPSQLQQWIQEGYFTHDLPVSASPNGPFQPMQNDQKVQMNSHHQEHHYDPYSGNEMQQYERQQYQVQQYEEHYYEQGQLQGDYTFSSISV